MINENVQKGETIGNQSRGEATTRMGGLGCTAGPEREWGGQGDRW